MHRLKTMPGKAILLRRKRKGERKRKRKGKRKADDQADDAVTQWVPWETACGAALHNEYQSLTGSGISDLCRKTAQNGGKKYSATGSFEDSSGI